MSNPKPSFDATRSFLKSLKLRDLIQELHKGKVSLNAPPKPNEIITIKTSTSVGDALKVRNCFEPGENRVCVCVCEKLLQDKLPHHYQ